MKLKVKDLDVATGGVLIAIINEKDAAKLDLHAMDRIKIRKGKKIETAILNISESPKTVPRGFIGIFDELITSLNLRNNDNVEIMFARKPLSIDYIKKKLDGYILNRKEIDQIVWDIVHNKLTSIELTYFVSACYAHNLNLKETIYLTKSIANNGDILKLDNYPIIDKHCVGGVPGNRTTIVLVPIISAAGFTIPKTSSRSITSPAGTADTMEVLAKVDLSLDRIKTILKKTNGCIVWGGALNLAPADDKIIQVEKPLNIDAESQLLASIMAKKYSVSSTHILIDIPSGRGTKFHRKKEALRVKKDFEEIGRKLHKKVSVMITDGSEPIGNGIGPALEARDVLWILKRDKRRPLDLERKCIKMAANIFKMIGLKNSRKKVIEILESGKAYKKMIEIINAQGKKIIDPEKIIKGEFNYEIKAPKQGKIVEIKNHVISRLARVAGAPQDKESGIYLYKHVNAFVKKNDKLYTIYSKNKEKLEYAKSSLKQDNGFVIK